MPQSALDAFPTFGRSELNRWGNRSLMTFKPGSSIPGYTGFLSSNDALLVSAKPNLRESYLGDHKPETTALTSQKQKFAQSLYESEYAKDPATYPRPYARKENPAEAASTTGHAPREHRFVAETTYGTNFRASTAPINATRTKVDTLATAKAGYLTSYNSMAVSDARTGLTMQAERRPATATLAQPPASLKPAPGTTIPRVMVHTTSYMEDYSLAPPASDSALRAGTTVLTQQIPGYTGYIPHATTNPVAVEQAMQPDSQRTQRKQGVLLSTLDQYSRGHMPNYLGFRPKDPTNQTVFESSNALMQTTTGRAEHWGTFFPSRPAKNLSPNKKRTTADGRPAGLMGFFEAGKDSVSDNGKTNAQQYYVHARPYEGLPMIGKASSMNYHGAGFTNKAVDR